MPDDSTLATPAADRAGRLGAGTRRTARAHRAGEGDGRRRPRRAPARRAAGSPSASASTACWIPAASTRSARIAGKATYDADSRQIVAFMPANCVFGRGTVDGRPVVIAGDDFTLRGGSADASIKGKPKMSEQIAAEFRMPIIRLIEGSGGGGSVKTIETTGRANLPGGLSETTSFDLVANNMGDGAGGGAGPWLGRRPGRGAAGGQPLFGDGEGDVRRVRRRPAGGRAAGRAAHQAGTRRLGGAACLRRGGSRGGHRGRGVRGRAPLPVVSAGLDLGPAAAGAQLGRSGAARRVPDRRDPAR